MVSEAQKRATKKYHKNHYYNSNVHLPIEWREEIAERIRQHGSFNSYIKYLVENDLEEL